MLRHAVKKVSLTYLKAHFSKLLRYAEMGGEITITRYGLPVARLAPVPKGGPEKPD